MTSIQVTCALIDHLAQSLSAQSLLTLCILSLGLISFNQMCWVMVTWPKNTKLKTRDRLFRNCYHNVVIYTHIPLVP